MPNTGNTQQQINYGAAVNDGTGDPLRTAFVKTDDNFDNVWLAGPVGSNITIVNNTVQVNDTNGNLVLSPNGVGVVQTNSRVVPRLNNTYDLGSTALKYRAGYFGAGGLVVDGNVTVTGNLTAGNISYTGNVFVGDLQGSVYADDSTIMVDAIDNELFAGRATISGNVSATYFVGNASSLTSITGANVTGTVANAAYAVLSESAVSVPAGNITGLSNVATTGSYNDLTDTPTIPTATSNLTNDSGFITAATANVVSVNGQTGAVTLSIPTATSNLTNDSGFITASVTGNFDATGNISANYFIGDGSQLTGLPESYGNADVATFLSNFGSNNITTTGNVTGGNLITAGRVSASGNILGLNFATEGSVQASSVQATGNVTATAFIGDGSQLTGLPASYSDSNVVTLLAGFGSNTISTTGNITGNVIAANTVQGDANLVLRSNTAGSVRTYTFNSLGDLSMPVGGNIESSGLITANRVSATGNITTTGSVNTAGNINFTSAEATDTARIFADVSGTTTSLVLEVGDDASDSIVLRHYSFAADTTLDMLTAHRSSNTAANVTVTGNLIATNQVTATGNVTGGNLISAATIYGNVDVVLGNIANASATKTRIVTDTTFSYIQTGNGTVGTTGNIVFSPYLNTVQQVVIDTASGNLSAAGNITAQNFIGNISITGNVIGTSANVDLVSGSNTWSFNNTGNLVLPGNTFAVNYANNTPVDVVTRFESFWTVPVGNSTQSFTVSPNETYYMWVDCNIPNGILTWNATATITNTNVPVVGAQYAWVYDGGGTPIDFTSIPDQFVGTANTIVRSNVAPSATTNRFDFGINNASGSEQIVRYGWIQIS